MTTVGIRVGLATRRTMPSEYEHASTIDRAFSSGPETVRYGAGTRLGGIAPQLVTAAALGSDAPATAEPNSRARQLLTVLVSMRRRRPEVLKIISTADAAVGDPAACPNVLRALTVATDGIGAMLTAGSFHESKHGFIVSSSLSDERGEVYLEHFQVNPLAPSLVQACGIAMRMGQASYEALLTDSLDHLPTAIMLVDDQARVVIANKQAKSLMVSHGGLAITDGILGAIAHTDSVRLREVIRSAALNAVRDDACVIHGSDGTPSFIVSGLPMPDAKAHFGIRYGAHAMLVLSSVEDRVRESAAKCSRLMKLFGLTRMESRVAIAIAKGGSVPEAAHELSIGSQTVRTHLREVFEKTGVNRQSALTRLLTRCGLLDLD